LRRTSASKRLFWRMWAEFTRGRLTVTDGDDDLSGRVGVIMIQQSAERWLAPDFAGWRGAVGIHVAQRDMVSDALMRTVLVVVAFDPFEDVLQIRLPYARQAHATSMVKVLNEHYLKHPLSLSLSVKPHTTRLAGPQSATLALRLGRHLPDPNGVGTPGGHSDKPGRHNAGSVADRQPEPRPTRHGDRHGGALHANSGHSATSHADALTGAGKKAGRGNIASQTGTGPQRTRNGHRPVCCFVLYFLAAFGRATGCHKRNE